MNLKKVAGPTRLELATSGVTGRRSNQLNYDPANIDRSGYRDIGLSGHRYYRQSDTSIAHDQLIHRLSLR